jgi:hypothetical protein
MALIFSAIATNKKLVHGGVIGRSNPFEHVFVLQKERGRATHRYVTLTD